MKYMLDTHTWIWWNMQPHKLSSKVRDSIIHMEKYEEMLLSAISPWEFTKLIEKGRLGVSCHPEEWIKKAIDLPKLRLVPLSLTIAYRSTALPQPFHDDPADQIIVATARDENAILLTKDKRILEYDHVMSMW
ncbi:MAG: type II toxin-antitoxin system VapC family toxin [bacterium]